MILETFFYRKPRTLRSVMSEWHLYIIRLKNNQLYTGIAKDVEARFCQHCADGKQAAKFLRGKGPLKLVFQQKIGSKSQALKAESAVKKLSKSEKEKMLLLNHPVCGDKVNQHPWNHWKNFWSGGGFHQLRCGWSRGGRFSKFLLRKLCTVEQLQDEGGASCSDSHWKK